MKILYYNWVQFDDPEKRGGGVSVYLNNLIDQLIKQNIDVYFLSSGMSYNFFRSDTYTKKTRNIFGNKCKTFEIVNSRVMAPGHFSFNNIKDAIENKEMTEVFYKFLKENGPFDVIHFHNLEGIPLSFLKLSHEFSRAKVYFTLHNYFPFCPQVNLWRQESQNCRNYLDGARCVNCLTYEPPCKAAIRAHQLAFLLKSLGVVPETKLFRFVFRQMNILKRVYRWFYALRNPQAAMNVFSDHIRKLTIEGMKSAKIYAERRQHYVSALNKYCQKVIAVSQRTAALAKGFNVNGSKLTVIYIGTKQADNIKARRDPPEKGEVVTFLYMGYMRRDKGFYFLIDALEKLSRRNASKMRIVIAARISDYNVVQRLKGIADKYHEIIIYDGYTHSSLPEILKGVDVGIVPVLWEDNLPQVATEMVSNGIPIITSDLGGSSELSQCKKFVFNAGSNKQFEQVIKRIIDDPSVLKSYWDDTLTLRTMPMHTDELFKLYRACETGNFESEDSDYRLCERQNPF
jgi:glycosyltransferase involved in cell wall biosynthesis